MVDGVTRFEAEVLGRGRPWRGGEGYGRIERANAFAPDASSFVVIVLGSNDACYVMRAEETVANLQWMIDRWVAAGLRADHVVLTTVSPRGGRGGGDPIARINDGVRALSAPPRATPPTTTAAAGAATPTAWTARTGARGCARGWPASWWRTCGRAAGRASGHRRGPSLTLPRL